MEPHPIIIAFALAGIVYFLFAMIMRKDTEENREAFWQCSRTITAMLGTVLVMSGFYYAVHWIGHLLK
jgi:hypothetical protein